MTLSEWFLIIVGGVLILAWLRGMVETVTDCWLRITGKDRGR